MGNKAETAYSLSHNYRFRRSQRNSYSLSVSEDSPDFPKAAPAADWDSLQHDLYPNKKSLAVWSILCKLRGEPLPHILVSRHSKREADSGHLLLNPALATLSCHRVTFSSRPGEAGHDLPGSPDGGGGGDKCPNYTNCAAAEGKHSINGSYCITTSRTFSFSTLIWATGTPGILFCAAMHFLLCLPSTDW